MSAVLQRRVAAIEELARRLLPDPAPDPDDPRMLVAFLTNEELARLEGTCRRAAEGELDVDQAAAWDDAQRRALARMLTGVDVKALSDRELDGRVLVPIPLDEPPLPGRTRLVGYVPDAAHPDMWHVEAVYRGKLPRTLTTADLATRDPMPWPPRVIGQ
jgi:hypothetical protein